MNVFEAVKENVTARQAAEMYGIRVNRNGMACCPFHDDKHPSMKVDKRFHCFGCQADGDVIDFAARLYGLNNLGAAVKLASDFGMLFIYEFHFVSIGICDAVKIPGRKYFRLLFYRI